MTSFRIDEIYIPKRGKNRQAYTLLFDATHNSFIGLVPGKSENAIGPALDAIRARCTIVSVTMDFGEYIPIVKRRFLTADRHVPAKQRHTARRIWQRLCSEMPGFTASERTVRGYVLKQRRKLGMERYEVFIPQSYQMGVEAQVDWYEAVADLNGERVKVFVFAMRSMASGAAYHRAFLHATQQAFLEAHEQAFHYFGGVFRTLRYDFVPGNKIVVLCR